MYIYNNDGVKNNYGIRLYAYAIANYHKVYI